MDDAINILSWICLVLGAFFVFSGALGLLRFPDFFTRLHPAGLKDSMGAPLMLIGLMLKAGLTLVSAKIALLILFLLITSPTSCHALARAALASGLKPVGEVRDDIPKRKSRRGPT